MVQPTVQRVDLAANSTTVAIAETMVSAARNVQLEQRDVCVCVRAASAAAVVAFTLSGVQRAAALQQSAESTHRGAPRRMSCEGIHNLWSREV